MLPLRLALSVLLLALAAGTASAVENALVLDYDFRFGPLRLVAMHTTVDLDGERYRTEAEMHTVGMVGYLFPWTSHARTAGVRVGGSLQPQEHRSQGIFRGEKRLVEIDYGSAGEVNARSEPPPENDWRDGVPLELQQGTVDPLTASLAAIENKCTGVVRVFDGRRRYDMNLTDMGEDDVEASSNHVYAGRARRCHAVVQALGGFWRTDPRQSETPTTLDSWVAVPRPGLLPVPVYLELAGPRGTLRIHLIAVEQTPG